MTRLHAVGLAALLAMLTMPALAVERAQHTVDWYRTHPDERESVLKTCQNDHADDSAADCGNATSAAHAAVADSLARAETSDPEADPAYYAHNTKIVAITLALCAHHAAPSSWCEAARTAARTQTR